MKTGITGGIGSGKSYVCNLLRKRGIEVYDCDAAAKRLMCQDSQLMRQLTCLIGPDTYTPDPITSIPLLNKSVVARFLLESEANALAIDAIVHPAVFRDFYQSGIDWMESAIMFESGANKYVDRVVVVTAPEETRLLRVMMRDGITREKALEWMMRQWPQEEVVHLADYTIINDGKQALEPQIDTLLQILKKEDIRKTEYP